MTRAREIVRDSIRNHANRVHEQPFGKSHPPSTYHDGHFGSQYVAGVEQREREGIEALYVKFEGDPLDLPWSRETKETNGKAYASCPGVGRKGKNPEGDTIECSECGRRLSVTRRGGPYRHKN